MCTKPSRAYYGNIRACDFQTNVQDSVLRSCKHRNSTIGATPLQSRLGCGAIDHYT